jgi:choline kinase
MKQAIILAAGKGARLGGTHNGHAKCLVEIAGETLIHRQMAILSSVGVERFFIVVGHERDDVCSVLDARCTPVVNADFAETNSLYSLWLALKEVSGPFMLVNSDVLAHPDVYRRVAKAEGAALAFDSSSGDEDEHMKVRFHRGRLREISKSLTADATDGENVGILRFDECAGKELFAAADAIISGGDVKCWAPAAVDRLAQATVVRGIDIADLPWTEIDFPEDLENARENVWPAIAKCAMTDPTGCGSGLNGQSNLTYRDRPSESASGLTGALRPNARRRAMG